MTPPSTEFSLRALVAALAFPVLAGQAGAETTPVVDDDIQRIEKSTRPDRDRLRGPDGKPPMKLKDGASLFMSFDADRDGRVVASEIETGITEAFAAADKDGGGFISVLEQQSWAESLRPVDSSLANPVRFDPNLDRRISFGEFNAVILGLAEDFSDEATGDVILADLKEPVRIPGPEERPGPDRLQGGRGGEGPPRGGRGQS